MACNPIVGVSHDTSSPQQLNETAYSAPLLKRYAQPDLVDLMREGSGWKGKGEGKGEGKETGKTTIA